MVTIKKQNLDICTFIYAEDENGNRYRLIISDDRGSDECSGIYLNGLDAEIPDNVTVSENKVEC